MEVKKTRSLLVAFFLFSFMAHGNVGFSTGDEFTSQNFEGSLTLFCPGGMSRLVSCSGYGLSPAEYDHLVFPSSIEADKVTLTRVSSRGKQRSKTSKVRSGEGRSQKSFNLWIKTLLQRPLLVLGNNTIKYEFEKDGNTTSTGEFHVLVREGETKTCRHAIYNGTSRDCETPSLMCSRYFSSNQYCN